MASTAAVQAALSVWLRSWAASVAPIAARDPAAFYQTDINMAGLLGRMQAFIDNPKWDDSLVIRVTNSDIRNLTQRLNQTFGVGLSAPQFQGPVVAPEILSPPLTPEVVATFGPGVDLSQIATKTLEAAALIHPASQAAVFLAEGLNLQGEPPMPPPQPETQPDASLAVQEKRILPTTTETDMPFHADVYGQPNGFPRFPPPIQPSGNGGGDPLIDLITGGLELLFPDSPAVEFLGDVADLLIPPITATGDQPPGLPTGPGFAPGLQQTVLDWMKRYPPTTFLGWTGQAILDAWENWKATGASPITALGAAPQVGLNGQAAGACGIPASMVNTSTRIMHTAPKGYVVVECTGSNGLPVKVAMLKELAIKYGKWRRPKKPPVSAARWSNLKKADADKKRLMKTLGPSLGMVRKPAPRRKAATCE